MAAWDEGKHPRGPGGEWITLGTHVRVKSGYHGGKEGHVVGVTDTGYNVDLGGPNPVPIKKDYVEPTGKPSITVEAPKTHKKLALSDLKPGMKVRVPGGKTGTILRPARGPHGEPGADVNFHESGREGYGSHWMDLGALHPVSRTVTDPHEVFVQRIREMCRQAGITR